VSHEGGEADGVVTSGQVAFDLHARALEVVRHRVITRQCPLDQPLDARGLAEELELPRQIVSQALLTLVAEGLLTPRGESEIVVRAVDELLVDQGFRARVAMELGAAELTVGRVPNPELRELRDRAWATAALAAGGQLVDVDAYIEADAAFHEYLVWLAGSDALVVAYRRASLPALMAGRSSGHTPTDAVLSRDHLALVDAYEAGSLDEARHAIRAHNDHVLGARQGAVLAAGGRI
jgi:DNA-binding GntR family transcriptional regulator